MDFNTMDTEQIITIIIGIIGGVGGIGFYIKRLFDAALNQFRNKSQADMEKLRTELQIALTRATGDVEAERAQSQQMDSLIDLLRQQITQQAQATIQNAQIEADKTTAQNNLAGAIREAVESMRENQRNVATQNEAIIRANRADLDEFKTTITARVNTIEIGFRTISDTFILLNSQLTQVLEKMNSTIDMMNATVVSIHNETVSVRRLYTDGQEKLEDVVNLVTDMRNMTVTVTQTEETAKKMLIRPFDDGRPRITVSQWLNMQSQWVDKEDVPADVTQPIPDLQDEIAQAKGKKKKHAKDAASKTAEETEL